MVGGLGRRRTVPRCDLDFYGGAVAPPSLTAGQRAGAHPSRRRRHCEFIYLTFLIEL
jgi:hypothetical protein